jgi:hypothetical protein
LNARRVRVAALVGCVALLSARGAFAEKVDDSTRNAARSLAEQGKELFDKEDFERARDLFHRAYTLVPAPTIALYEARSLAKLGRLVEAEEAFIRAARTKLDANSSDQFRKAVADAEYELLAVQARIPKVTLIVAGPGAQAPDLSVLLDGEVVANALIGVEKPINPGSHLLTAGAPGAEQTQITFSIQERERKRVEIQAASSPARPITPAPVERAKPVAKLDVKSVEPATSWHTPAALVAGGLGLAGVATGVVAGTLAGSRYSKAQSDCPSHVCVEGTPGADALQSFRSLRNISTIGYAVGGVGLAAGVTLFVTTPAKHSTGLASVGVWVGGQGAGVLGAF